MATAEKTTKLAAVAEILATPEGAAMTGVEIAQKVGGNKNNILRIVQELRANPPARMVRLDSLVRSAKTQMRPTLDPDRVKMFADAYSDEEAEVNPVDAWLTPEGMYLTDGFHRAEGAAQAGRVEIPARVRVGTLRDAILAGVKANVKGTLPRCAATKRNAVLTLLADPEWSQNTLRWVATEAGVSHDFASQVWRGFQAAAVKSAREAGETYEPPAKLRDPRGRMQAAPSLTPPFSESSGDVATRPDPSGDRDESLVDAASTRAEPEAETPPPVDPMADYLEWLDGGEGKQLVRDRLPQRQREVYDRDARMYRELHESPAWASFVAVANRLVGAKKVGDQGGYALQVSFFLSKKHPRDWTICFACKGTGKHVEGQRCEGKGCGGRGYVVS